MECCRCNKKFYEVNGMIPIDPKGTKSRRWICTDCATNNEIDSIDKEVVELSTIINSNFIHK